MLARYTSGMFTCAALYDTLALSLTFDPSAAPIPEPASLLLIGTGLVGVFVRRARRAPMA